MKKNIFINKAKELDQFYTNPNVTDYLIEKLIKLNFLKNNNIVLEPSAGSGNFIDSIHKVFKTKIKIEAFDIEPKNNKLIKKVDYLKKQINFNKNRIIIGNPPFGKRGKLALKFLNKGFDEASTIAMILPKTFNRYSIQKNINKDAKLIYSDILPRNSFLIDDREYNVNCVFQIWTTKNTKKKNLRLKKPLPIRHIDLQTYIHNNTKATLKYFKKKEYKWTYAIHRQGYYDYSSLITDSSKLVKNRQYFFIKCKNKISKEIVEKINFSNLAKTNTSTPGFSTTDFIKEYTRLKGEHNAV